MTRPAAWPVGVAFGVALLAGIEAARAVVTGFGGTDVVGFALSLPGLEAVAMSNAVVLGVVAVVAARWTGGAPDAPLASALRLGRSRATTASYLAAAAATVGASLACSAASDLAGVGGGPVMDAVAASVKGASPRSLALATVTLACVPAIAEETFFRGLLQTRLVAAWGRAPGIAASAIAFGVFHLDPVQGLQAALLGVLLGWLADRFASVRPPLLAHAANNLLFIAIARAGLAIRPAWSLFAGTALAAFAVALAKSPQAVKPAS